MTPKNSETGSDTPKTTIALLLPTRGLVFTRSIVSVLRELAPHRWDLFYTDAVPLPESRNVLIEQAKKSGRPYTHYLLLDDDVVIPVGGLQAMLDLDKDVVLIDYPTHWLGKGGKNTGTAVYDNWEIGKDFKKLKVLWAGLGCTLIKAKVFDAFKKPYFRTGGQLYDRLPGGKIALYGVIQNSAGEDYEFYQDCREKGFEIAVVHEMVAQHGKVMRHIGVVDRDKYIRPHEIHYADKIERPLK